MDKFEWIAVVVLVGLFCLRLGEKIGGKQDCPQVIVLKLAKPATKKEN